MTEAEKVVKTEEPFVFGPNQTKWLAALESGEFLQGKDMLRNDEDDSAVRYYCLGVANVVCALRESWEHTELNDTYDLLGLYDNDGPVIKTLIGPAVTDYRNTLVEMNDDNRDRWTFAKIAAFIRAHPRAVFKESK